MSKKALMPLTVAGALLVSASAFAAAMTKTGEVKTIDAAKHELVLSSGDAFQVGSHIKLDKLKSGERVTITYEMKDGKMHASKVDPSP